MGRLFGLILFFIGVGMVIGIALTESVWVNLMCVVCLLCGYHLFCR
ncbi:MAG: hypothetical protein LUF78_11765 [Clostridiales bacterium]|nr:hypothetical protein [Clostridiales bacterium]MCD8155334.1 hypothetical protein [Clostridiales bacterium]